MTITVDGRPVAVLRPVTTRGRWMSRGEFARTFTSAQADAALAADLAELVPDTTDDVPLA